MHRTNGTRRLRTAALVACALLAQACSTIFVRPPSSTEASEPPRCTESRAAPIADTVVAGAALTLGLVGLQAALSYPCCVENAGPAVAVLSGLVLLGTGASAIHGFRATSQCREAVTSWCGSHDCEGHVPEDDATR